MFNEILSELITSRKCNKTLKGVTSRSFFSVSLHLLLACVFFLLKRYCICRRFYITRPTVFNTKLIVEQIKGEKSVNLDNRYTIVMVPRSVSIQRMFSVGAEWTYNIYMYLIRLHLIDRPPKKFVVKQIVDITVCQQIIHLHYIFSRSWILLICSSKKRMMILAFWTIYMDYFMMY